MAHSELMCDAFLGEHTVRPRFAVDTALAWRCYLTDRAAEAVGWLWMDLSRPGAHRQGEAGWRAGEWRLRGYQRALARLRRGEPVTLTLGTHRWEIRPVRALRLVPVPPVSNEGRRTCPPTSTAATSDSPPPPPASTG
ncbi:hypothetical protein [Streptomyces mayteni]